MEPKRALLEILKLAAEQEREGNELAERLEAEAEERYAAAGEERVGDVFPIEIGEPSKDDLLLPALKAVHEIIMQEVKVLPPRLVNLVPQVIDPAIRKAEGR